VTGWVWAASEARQWGLRQLAYDQHLISSPTFQTVTPSSATQEVEPGQTLLAAGWGKVPGATATSPDPNTVLTTELSAVGLEECQEW